MADKTSEEIYRFVNTNGFALILARGGSKSIPMKNIALLNGKPLINYTLEAAINSKIFDEIFVSTDSDAIASACSNYGVRTLIRESELAGDSVTSYQSAVGVFKQLKSEISKYDWFALLQPTSPLRTSKNIIEAFELFVNSGMRSVAGVVEANVHPYKCFFFDGDEKSFIGTKENLEMPRQLLPKAYHVNGSLYFNKITTFQSNRSFLSNDFIPYEMDDRSSLDIDNFFDLMFADYLIRSDK